MKEAEELAADTYEGIKLAAKTELEQARLIRPSAEAARMYAAIHSDDPQSQQARATQHNEYSETHILGPHIFVSLEILLPPPVNWKMK